MLNKITFLLNHQNVRNFLNYYIFTIINAVFGLFSISYLTNMILPRDFGMIGIYSSILFFLPPLISFSANGLQAIEIVDLDSGSYLEFRNSYISFVLVSFIFFLLLAVIFSLFYKEFSFVIISATIMGLISILTSIHNTELFQYSLPTRYGLISSTTVLLGFGLTILFLSIFSFGWEFRIIALIITEFIILLFRYFYMSTIGSKFQFSFDKNQFLYIVRYGAPLILSVLAGWILNNSDRYFLLNYFTLKEVGIYTASTGIASFIVMINSNLIKVLYPLVYQKLNRNEGKKFILKITGLYSILILSITFIFCLFLNIFGNLFFGEKYISSMSITYIMCLAQSFFGIYTISALVIDYFKMTRLKTILVVLSSIIIIILTYILMPIIGHLGPAVATLISFLFLSILSFFISLEVLKKHKIL